jgi:menaquinone-dependent protoporphyrinogen oxidase
VLDATSHVAVDLAHYGHVVLAASAHLGKHEREMVTFVKAHKTALDQVPTSFLSVSLSEAGAEDPKASPEQHAEATAAVKKMIARFLEETDLWPDRILPVAGALHFSMYGWLVRVAMRGISKRGGGPTDVSKDYEMTDWVSLDRFAEEVVRTVQRGAGEITASP